MTRKTQKYQKSSLAPMYLGGTASRCFAVYHEDRTGGALGNIDFGSEAYHVPKFRGRSWEAYANQTHVVYEGFNYGELPIGTFLSLISGIPTTIPGSYGHKKATPSRIDFVSSRPFGNLYQESRRGTPSLTRRLRRNLSVVIRYFRVSRIKGAPATIYAVAIKGTDYAATNWESVEQACKTGNALPDAVLCSGTPGAVADFIATYRQCLGKKTPDEVHLMLRKAYSTRWALDINYPRDWVESFATRNGFGDITSKLLATDWNHFDNACRGIYEILSASSESEVTGIVGVACQRESAITIVVEHAHPLSASEVVRQYQTCGKIVLGDGHLRERLSRCHRVEVPVMALGTMAGLPLMRQQGNSDRMAAQAVRIVSSYDGERLVFP